MKHAVESTSQSEIMSNILFELPPLEKEEQGNFHPSYKLAAHRVKVLASQKYLEFFFKCEKLF